MSLNSVIGTKLILMFLNRIKWFRRPPEDLPVSGTLQPGTPAETMNSPTVSQTRCLLNSRCGQTSRTSASNSVTQDEHSFEEDSEEMARGVCNIGMCEFCHILKISFRLDVQIAGMPGCDWQMSEMDSNCVIGQVPATKSLSSDSKRGTHAKKPRKTWGRSP